MYCKSLVFRANCQVADLQHHFILGVSLLGLTLLLEAHVAACRANTQFISPEISVGSVSNK